MDHLRSPPSLTREAARGLPHRARLSIALSTLENSTAAAAVRRSRNTGVASRSTRRMLRSHGPSRAHGRPRPPKPHHQQQLGAGKSTAALLREPGSKGVWTSE